MVYEEDNGKRKSVVTLGADADDEGGDDDDSACTLESDFAGVADMHLEYMNEIPKPAPLIDMSEWVNAISDSDSDFDPLDNSDLSLGAIMSMEKKKPAKRQPREFAKQAEPTKPVAVARRDVSTQKATDPNQSPKRANRRTQTRNTTTENQTRSKSLTGLQRSSSDKSIKSKLAQPRAKDLQQNSHLNADWDGEKPLTKRRMSSGKGDLLALVVDAKKDQPIDPRKANRRGRTASRANKKEDTRSRSCTSLKRSEPRAKDLVKDKHNEDWVEQKPLTKRRMSAGNGGDLLSLVEANKGPTVPATKADDDQERPIAKRALSAADLSKMLDPSKFSYSDTKKTLQNSPQEKPQRRRSLNTANLSSLLDPSKFSLSSSRRCLMADAEPEPPRKEVASATPQQRKSSGDLLAGLKSKAARRSKQPVQATPMISLTPKQRKSANDLMALLKNNAAKIGATATPQVQAQPTKDVSPQQQRKSANDLMALLKSTAARRAAAAAPPVQTKPVCGFVPQQRKSATDLIAMLKNTSAKRSAVVPLHVQTKPINGMTPQACKSANDLMALLKKNATRRGSATGNQFPV